MTATLVSTRTVFANTCQEQEDSWTRAWPDKDDVRRAADVTSGTPHASWPQKLSRRSDRRASFLQGGWWGSADLPGHSTLVTSHDAPRTENCSAEEMGARRSSSQLRATTRNNESNANRRSISYGSEKAAWLPSIHHSAPGKLQTLFPAASRPSTLFFHSFTLSSCLQLIATDDHGLQRAGLSDLRHLLQHWPHSQSRRTASRWLGWVRRRFCEPRG